MKKKGNIFVKRLHLSRHTDHVYVKIVGYDTKAAQRLTVNMDLQNYVAHTACKLCVRSVFELNFTCLAAAVC